MIAGTMRGFTARLTDYGRGSGLKIYEIPYSEAQRIYEEQAKDQLPLTEQEFREVISAETMVFGRKGLGGPQISETTRMLEGTLANIKKNSAWLDNRRGQATKTKEATNTIFIKLLK